VTFHPAPHYKKFGIEKSFKFQGPKTFLCLANICKLVQLKSNCKLLWIVKRPNQAHYEMTLFVIFNSKEIEISKHHQQAREITKQHCCDIKKGNIPV